MKFTGISYHKGRRKWQAQVSARGHTIHIGFYDTRSDAVIGRNEWIRQKFGHGGKQVLWKMQRKRKVSQKITELQEIVGVESVVQEVRDEPQDVSVRKVDSPPRDESKDEVEDILKQLEEGMK